MIAYINKVSLFSPLTSFSFVLVPFALHKLQEIVIEMFIGKVFQGLTVLSIALI